MTNDIHAQKKEECKNCEVKNREDLDNALVLERVMQLEALIRSDMYKWVKND